jgi:hypothetical protein
MCLSKRHVVTGALFSFAVLVGGDVAPAAGDALDAIFATWAKCREEARTVSYDADGLTIVPKEGTKSAGHVFAEDQRQSCSGRWLMDFARNEFRIETESQTFSASRKAFLPEHVIFSYVDGELTGHKVSVTEHRGDVFSKKQPEFYHYKPDYPVLTMTKIPPLLAHGYLPKAFFVDAESNRQRIGALERRDVQLQSAALIDGQECLVLRIATAPGSGFSWFELWVEADELHRVRRARLGSRDRVSEETDLSYGFDGDTSALRGWNYVRNDQEGKPIRIVEMNVRLFTRNVAVERADLAVRPRTGMIVLDERTAEYYAVGSKGEHVAVTPGSNVEPNARHASLYVFAVVCVLGVTCVILIVYLRRRRA